MSTKQEVSTDWDVIKEWQLKGEGQETAGLQGREAKQTPFMTALELLQEHGGVSLN